jgi:hypothetical protein
VALVTAPKKTPAQIPTQAAKKPAEKKKPEVVKKSEKPKGKVLKVSSSKPVQAQVKKTDSNKKKKVLSAKKPATPAAG